MGVNLSQGNDGVALLANSIATGAGLFVLISLLGNISGAHFNPAVSILFYLRKELSSKKLVNYMIFQFLGGFLAVIAIHYIFNIEISDIKKINTLPNNEIKPGQVLKIVIKAF